MKSPYHGIKGLGTGAGKLQVGVRSRLYEGPDHLLVVQSTGYTEDYKRVAYQNIRYVIIRRTFSQQRQAMISAGLFLLISLLYLTPVPWPAVLTFSASFAIWFVVNIVKGPGCLAYVNTDIQTVELPVPRRVNKVPVFIEFLRSKTASAPAPAASTV